MLVFFPSTTFGLTASQETSFSRTLFDGLDGRSTPWYSTVQQQRADYSRLDLWTPTPSQLELCWHIYVENVDPIVRILHKPSVRTMLLASQQKKFDELDTGSCALLLAICFAAVNSLDMPRCRALFEEDGLRMKLRCKRSAELAIAQARLVQTHNFQVLQAFTLYLVWLPPTPHLLISFPLLFLLSFDYPLLFFLCFPPCHRVPHR